MLQLKFPPKRDSEREPDFYAKPVFMLLMNHGHEGQHYYDTMEVDDETWETCVLLLLSRFVRASVRAELTFSPSSSPPCLLPLSPL